MMYWFGNKSEERLKSVVIAMQHIMREAIKSSPIDFGIPEYGGWRSAEEQHQLFLDGKSTLDGYIKKSEHQDRKAIDIYAYVNGKASWKMQHLNLLAGHIIGTANRMGYKLRWGGDFNGNWSSDDEDFVDAVHFELVVD
jgi:peptidoglycan L-alanyl-D-glutamate endopeptidase CwlK